MAKNENAFTFVQDVRDEVGKVVWPTRRELGISTVMVLIMVARPSDDSGGVHIHGKASVITIS